MNKIFAAYITAGDGSFDQQLQYIRALLAGGVNLLEIGIPFSDPIADGPVIQRAMQRALKAGTTIEVVIRLIKAVRQESDVEIVVFTYYNPILQCQNSEEKLKEAGANGILIVDYVGERHAGGLYQVPIIAPSTSEDRIKMLVQSNPKLLYYACQKGTTGARKSLPEDLAEKIASIKQITQIPVMVGFGIADPDSAKAICEIADGFVIGSHFIEAMEKGVSADALKVMALSFCPGA